MEHIDSGVQPNIDPGGDKTVPNPGRRKFLKAAALATGVVVVGKYLVDKYLHGVGKEDKIAEIDGTKITYLEFKPEKENDPTKIVVSFPGWPWSAAEEATWNLSKTAAEQFGIRAFNISANRGIETQQDISKKAEDIKEFFLRQGIKEVTAVFGHSVGATLAAYFEVAAQNSDLKVKQVVLANPRGLDNTDILSLGKAFRKDAFGLVDEERKKLRKADVPDPKKDVIQAGFIRSLVRPIKEHGLSYIPILWNQLRNMTSIDPVFTQIKAPVTLLVAEKDLVSDYRRYIPQGKVDPLLEQLSTEDQLKGKVDLSKKWENLLEEEKKEREEMVNSEEWKSLTEEQRAERLTGLSSTEKFGSKEGFTMEYLKNLGNRIKRGILTRGRERYLKEEVFTKAQDVKLIRSERQGDHNAVIGPRQKQVVHIPLHSERSKAA